MRLAKLLLRRTRVGDPNDPAHRKTLLEFVIGEVTSNCTEEDLPEAEKERKGKEIRFLIRMNQDSLLEETGGTEELGTMEGNIRFIKIVEMALSRMTKKVSKTEKDNWLSCLDADLFSLFGINETSNPRIPENKEWFSDEVIKESLKKLHETMTNKKDADLEELKGMVGLFFWQKIKDDMDDKSSEFYRKLNSNLMNSGSIADRSKIKKTLNNVKETDLKRVVPELLKHWNTLVENFRKHASLLRMKTTKMEKGNALEAFGPMTPEYFDKMMTDVAAGILKLKTYSDLTEKNRKAYANVKLFLIASKLRQIVINSRKNNSDTLTVGFTENECLCMQEASSKCKDLLKLVLSYAKAEKLVLEGSWIHDFLASCPKDNVKSLTLKGGSFGIGCLGKISTPIDEVTFEEMNLEALKALEQFRYLENGNSLTLRDVTCEEDYYQGEPGAIKDIRDNGATVEINRCLWYKTGTRPKGSGTAPTTAKGGAPTTTTGGTGSGSSAKNPFGPTKKFNYSNVGKSGTNTSGSKFTPPSLKPKQTTNPGTVPGSSTTDPLAAVRAKMKKGTTTGMRTTGGPATGENPFLAGKKLTKPTTTTKADETKPENPVIAAMRNLKKSTTTTGAPTTGNAFDPRSVLKKNVMHEGMLDKKDKEDFKKDLEDNKIKDGKDMEEKLLLRLEQEWAKIPTGKDIPVDVPFCKTYLKEVVKKAIEYAKDRNSSVILSGDFEKEIGVTFGHEEMVDLAKALKDARKIKTDIKSSYGMNISFQSELLKAMSTLKKNGKTIKIEEIELSGWSKSSEDAKTVLKAVGKLGLKKFEVSNMHEDMLGRSNFSTSFNRKGWENLLNNTENVSFKNQKMDATSLGGLLNAVNSVKKNGGKMPHIELPTPPARKPGATKETCEEKLTREILSEIANP